MVLPAKDIELILSAGRAGDGSGTYLDASAPRNRVLYERHGFRVVHEHHLPDGPIFWGMWRDPYSGGP